MFINDVGASAWEEINDGIAGSNYGWPTTEGVTSNPAFRSPGVDGITQIVARLPNNTPTGQSLWVSVTLRGQTSNKVRVRMK